MSDFQGNAESTTPTPSQIKLTALDLDKQTHTPGDIDMLYRVYAHKRIEAQVDFYQSRIKENERNADFTFGMGALVMTISSLVATVGASVRDPFWTPALTVMSAILPAFAALLAAFRQLYGWERQSSIYRDALLGLEKVRLLAPDDDRVAASSLQEIYPDLVKRSETVFTGEVSQWGQFVVDKDGEKSQGDTAMNQLFGNLNLTDAQRETIQSILVAGKAGDVSISAKAGTATNVELHSDGQDAETGESNMTASVSTVEATQTDAAVSTPAEPETLPFETHDEADFVEGEVVEDDADDNSKAVG